MVLLRNNITFDVAGNSTTGPYFRRNMKLLNSGLTKYLKSMTIRYEAKKGSISVKDKLPFLLKIKIV